MKIFLWTMLVLFVLAFLGGVLWLVNGVPERTRGSVAIDLIVAAAIAVWVSVLIFG